MTKTSDYSKIKKERDSIDNIRNENDCPEEIHFLYFFDSSRKKYGGQFK